MMYEKQTKDSMSLDKTKKEMINWINRVPAVDYAYKLHQLRVTVAEALFVMSSIREMGWRYQEDVVRMMITLEGEVR